MEIKKMKRLTELLLLSLILGLPVESFAQNNNDRQFWSGIGIEQKIVGNFSISISECFRCNNNMSDFYWHHTDIGVSYKFLPWFSLGLNCWQIYKGKEGVWKEHRRPHVNGTFSLPIKALVLSDRNRIEYRIAKDDEKTWMYRNKLELKIPIEVISIKISPYIAEEIFINFSEAEFACNRIYAGIKLKILKWAYLDTGYFWELKKGEVNDLNNHVINISLKIKM